MIWLFLFLAIFFAVRTFLYFSRGRLIAGILAGLACLLFLGAIYVDFARVTPAEAG